MADIILADDDKNNRFVISAHLRLRGHQVREAGSGAEALSLLAAARPDLVLLDLMMPELNGCETCRPDAASRRRRRCRSRPDRARRRSSIRNGCATPALTAWRSRPIAMDELHRIIGDALTANAAG